MLHEKVRAHHIHPTLATLATLASSLPPCAIQDCRKGVQGTTRPPVGVSGGRLPTYVCHWTSTAALVVDRHMPSAANRHTSWWSLIHCCWASRMEQSANPAARVGHYSRTISTSTQNASIWSLAAAAPSDGVFCVLCTNLLTYLLT